MKKWLLTSVMLLAAVCVFAQAEIPFVTTAQYDQLPTNNQVFVLIFTMDRYCPPCQAAKELLLPKLQEKYGQVENVHLYRVNMDQPSEKDANSLYGRYGVHGAPSFLVLVNNSLQFSQAGFNRKKSDELFQKIVTVVDSFK